LIKRTDTTVELLSHVAQRSRREVVGCFDVCKEVIRDCRRSPAKTLAVTSVSNLRCLVSSLYLRGQLATYDCRTESTASPGFMFVPLSLFLGDQPWGFSSTTCPSPDEFQPRISPRMFLHHLVLYGCASQLSSVYPAAAADTLPAKFGASADSSPRSPRLCFKFHAFVSARISPPPT